MTELPRLTAGISAHNNAVILPILGALAKSPYKRHAHFHKISVIKKCIIGADILTPKLLCPITAWVAHIIQAINGGFE